MNPKCQPCQYRQMLTCTKAKSPISSLSDCPLSLWGEPPYKWVVPKPLVLRPKSPRLVVTIAIGDEFQEILSYTRPAIKEYAERCNADYLEITDETQDWPLFEKFRLKQPVSLYARTLYIDADILIRPGCRDLFSFVSPQYVAMHDDYPYCKPKLWLDTEWNELMKTQYESLPSPGRCLNSGLIMCSSAHSAIFTPPAFPVYGRHCNEQSWIERNIVAHHIPICSLPQKLNLQWWMKEDWNKKNLAEAEIVHLASAPHKDRITFLKGIN